jgi:hypothetical protein
VGIIADARATRRATASKLPTLDLDLGGHADR